MRPAATSTTTLLAASGRTPTNFTASRSPRPMQLRKVKVEKDTSPYAPDIHSHILQNVVADLDKAFQAFFRRVKAGENPGYPRFKGRNRFAGFGFKEYGNGFKIDGRRLKLSGIGRIAVRWHREARRARSRRPAIFCRAGKWFVAFSCEVEKPEPLPKTGESIGVDLGLLRLATLSNGEEKENPRWYRRIFRKLRSPPAEDRPRACSAAANRRKAVLRLQRLMVQVANARKDSLNKFANELIKRFDRIVLEDLRVAAMARGRFAMSILDAGWSYLHTRLTHKAESAGREIGPGRPRLHVQDLLRLRCHLRASEPLGSLGLMRLRRVPGSGPQRRDQHPPPVGRDGAFGRQARQWAG